MRQIPSEDMAQLCAFLTRFYKSPDVPPREIFSAIPFIINELQMAFSFLAQETL
jgi:hypothetical protein